jgi:hypothetical protein
MSTRAHVVVAGESLTAFLDAASDEDTTTTNAGGSDGEGDGRSERDDDDDDDDNADDERNPITLVERRLKGNKPLKPEQWTAFATATLALLDSRTDDVDDLLDWQSSCDDLSLRRRFSLLDAASLYNAAVRALAADVAVDHRRSAKEATPPLSPPLLVCIAAMQRMYQGFTASAALCDDVDDVNDVAAALPTRCDFGFLSTVLHEWLVEQAARCAQQTTQCMRLDKFASADVAACVADAAFTFSSSVADLFELLYLQRDAFLSHVALMRPFAFRTVRTFQQGVVNVCVAEYARRVADGVCRAAGDAADETSSTSPSLVPTPDMWLCVPERTTGDADAADGDGDGGDVGNDDGCRDPGALVGGWKAKLTSLSTKAKRLKAKITGSSRSGVIDRRTGVVDGVPAAQSATLDAAYDGAWTRLCCVARALALLTEYHTNLVNEVGKMRGDVVSMSGSMSIDDGGEPDDDVSEASYVFYLSESDTESAAATAVAVANARNETAATVTTNDTADGDTPITGAGDEDDVDDAMSLAVLGVTPAIETLASPLSALLVFHQLRHVAANLYSPTFDAAGASLIAGRGIDDVHDELEAAVDTVTAALETECHNGVGMVYLPRVAGFVTAAVFARVCDALAATVAARAVRHGLSADVDAKRKVIAREVKRIRRRRVSAQRRRQQSRKEVAAAAHKRRTARADRRQQRQQRIDADVAAAVADAAILVAEADAAASLRVAAAARITQALCASDDDDDDNHDFNGNDDDGDSVGDHVSFDGGGVVVAARRKRSDIARGAVSFMSRLKIDKTTRAEKGVPMMTETTAAVSSLTTTTTTATTPTTLTTPTTPTTPTKPTTESTAGIAINPFAASGVCDDAAMTAQLTSKTKAAARRRAKADIRAAKRAAQMAEKVTTAAAATSSANPFADDGAGNPFGDNDDAPPPPPPPPPPPLQSDDPSVAVNDGIGVNSDGIGGGIASRDAYFKAREERAAARAAKREERASRRGKISSSVAVATANAPVRTGVESTMASIVIGTVIDEATGAAQACRDTAAARATRRSERAAIRAKKAAKRDGVANRNRRHAANRGAAAVRDDITTAVATSGHEANPFADVSDADAVVVADVVVTKKKGGTGGGRDIVTSDAITYTDVSEDTIDDDVADSDDNAEGGCKDDEEDLVRRCARYRDVILADVDALKLLFTDVAFVDSDVLDDAVAPLLALVDAIFILEIDA